MLNFEEQSNYEKVTDMLTLLELPLVPEQTQFQPVLPTLSCENAWRYVLQKHLQIQDLNVNPKNTVWKGCVR